MSPARIGQGGNMASPLTRRSVLQTAGATAAAAAISAPFVHGAYAAGQLKLGFWDHWVPGGNDALTKLCKEWGEKEKVEVQIDYITSQGDKQIGRASCRERV